MSRKPSTFVPFLDIEWELLFYRRLLGTSLLILLIVGSASATIQLVFVPGFVRTFVFMAPTLLVLLVAYVFVRKGHLQTAATLSSVVVILCCLGIFAFHSEDIFTLAFLEVGFFLAGLMLPFRRALWVTLLGCVGALGLFALMYDALPRKVLSGGIAYLLIMPTLTLVGMYAVNFHRRQQAQERMNTMLGAIEQSADAVAITDQEGVIQYVNASFEEITGYSKEEVLGKSSRVLYSGHLDDEFYEELWSTIQSGEVFREIFINRRKDGTLYYEQKTISPVRGALGEITHYVSSGTDVTALYEAKERLLYMAQHDPLTRLPNRSLFEDRLAQSIFHALRHERLLAVVFFDLDGFKDVNDSLGHPIGDKLLIAVAERLQAHLRSGDTLARFGGDEFTILFDDIAEEGDVERLLEEILGLFARPFRVEAHELFISASLGVSLFPTDGSDGQVLLKCADIAMYRAKDSGKNNYQFYTSELGARAGKRLELLNSMRQAIERGEFVLYYQPKIELESERIVGFEALLRWVSPSRGLVGPLEFLPVLEETGLIVPVGWWVIDEAIRQLQAWKEAGRDSVYIAINVSGRQCVEEGFAEELLSRLARAKIPPSRLEVEITESMLIEREHALRAGFERLAEAGVRLAMDDFGTGFSSLSYLKRFPLHSLKIDRAFVRDLPDDKDDIAITKAIIAMAERLGLEVVAEGIETSEQAAFLQSCGCQFGQGYLYGRPALAEKYLPLLSERLRS